MKFILTEDLFTNDEYRVSYGLKVATFTAVDESFVSSGSIKASIYRLICTIIEYDSAGEKVSEEFGNLIIGLGDSNVSVTSDDDALLGTLMTKDNMSSCTVELYE